MNTTIRECIFKYRWYFRIIFVLIIIGLFLLFLPTFPRPIPKEKLLAKVVLALLEKDDDVSINNNNVMLFNNHEYVFKHSGYESGSCITCDRNVNQLCSHIAGRICDSDNSNWIYFIIATGKDKSFHNDSVDFIKNLRCRNLSSNLKRLIELKSKADILGDIIITKVVSYTKAKDKIIIKGDYTDEKTE